MTKRLQDNSFEPTDLKHYNTFGLSAKAMQFFRLQHAGELIRLFKEHPRKLEHAIIIGGGSNVLITDDIEQLVIKNDIQGIHIIHETTEEVRIQVGGGHNWHRLVMYCVNKGWGGIENLALIPGTAGAAPIQNIGAYGVELASVFDSLEAFNLKKGKTETFSNVDCNFGYRNSIFKQQLKGKYIITGIQLTLQKKSVPQTGYASLEQKLKENNIPSPTIKDVANAVIAIRTRKLPDPEKIGNAGSFFKNPVISERKFKMLKKKYASIPGYALDNGKVKVPAGWLIDQAGWKGRQHGHAGVHENQALVLINKGNATAGEVLELAKMIKKDILARYDIALEEEVNILP